MDSNAIRDSTVLVTGGAGFIGSHLVEALVPHNEVRVLDDFTTGDRAHLPDDVTVVEGDVRDPIALQKAARGVEVIFHHAALVSVTQSVDDPRRSNRTNLEASLLVLEQARQEDARVVVASSAAVYGHPETLPVPETASTTPTSPYGVQKLAVDQYARLYEDLYGLETVALRYFNVYGPRQRGPYSGVISTFLEQARADEPITVEGDGRQSRDFVHVSDVVRANLRAATTDAIGEAYNIGTGQRTTILDLAETIRTVTGSDSTIVHREPRSGDIRHSGADTSKATHQLGFDATVGIESGIRSLVGDDRSDPADAATEIALESNRSDGSYR
ncbi:NAD-dependent epimerase/dehydratase family protein [Natrinema pallidum]|uniref:NAD-dependent epimerase/dehydratase n=1 Tax=Natrinema pallidum DSM 3751 TaxID=1227495 RepID=L9Z258_9EURY|nr:NAD-dependent epimerase/dehydratase family protein [Natrinema pallidum]ELY80580.1 NAD-dependent epimerase/dehydratase [Natrinema pallidum DSM 3751]